MKLREDTPQTIYRVGTDTSKGRNKLSLRANKKAYKILSSTVYKYKIRAIIRELSCNAIDGHKEAGNQNPFDVQLPTAVDPRFVIRDYGIGMSPDFVSDAFTVYFESTKNDSNDLIGSMGLGCKSPLCYADAFTVESVKDGIKCGYTIYMDDGEPFCDPLYEIESDEPNGVTITVPVKVEDIKEWENEAARVYESFTDIRPNFVGASILKINYQPKEATNDSGVIRHKSAYTSGVYARMGNIIYPLDKDLYDTSMFYCYTESQYTYIIDFPIGELDFMPSREELSMDKMTVGIIKERLKQISRVYFNRVKSEFDKLQTVRDKLTWFHSLPSMVQNFVGKDANFRINGDSIGWIHSELVKPNKYNDDYIAGYWANEYDGKDAWYQVTGSGGRWSKYKPETTKRQDITRIYYPWKQKKLILLKVDTNTVKPYIVGYAKMHNLSRVSFVAYYDSDSKREIVNDIVRKGHFDESEIVYLRTSEMTKEKEIYDADREKSKALYAPKNSEPRPKTPTVYRYELDSNGNLAKTSLFMTKSEFLSLDKAPGVRLYGIDEYSRLDGENSRLSMDSAMKESTLSRIMRHTGIPVVFAIRNSLWKWIPDSNLVCFDDMLCKQYVKSEKALKDNCLPGWIGKEHSTETNALHSRFGVSLDRIVKNRYNEKLYKIVDTLELIVCLEGYEKDGKNLSRARCPILRESVASMRVKRSNMKKRVDQAWEIFKSLNPLLASLVEHSDSYSIRLIYNNEKNLSEFKKLIRWK